MSRGQPKVRRKEGARRCLCAVASALAVLGPATLFGCDDILPTSTNPGEIPVESRSFLVELSFEEFAENIRVIDGFGVPFLLNTLAVSNQLGGSLDMRGLVRFDTIPDEIVAPDPAQGGDFRLDEMPALIRGQVVFDVEPLLSSAEGPIEIRAGPVAQNWHAPSASWDLRVDTLGVSATWDEPGAGPILDTVTAVWDPAEEVDTMIIEFDSAFVNVLREAQRVGGGLRLESLSEGTRLEMNALSARVRLEYRPSFNPDTIITIRPQNLLPPITTLIYSPRPEVGPQELRVGGAPAWRTVFDLALPDSVSAPFEVCGRLPCRVELDPRNLNFAGLVMRTRASPPGFVPTDTIPFDFRPVLEPDRLPKAALGPSIVGPSGILMAPEWFRAGSEEEVVIPMTRFLADFISGTLPAGAPISETLTFLTVVEPFTLEIMSFEGPGSENAPVLRLVITTTPGLGL